MKTSIRLILTLAMLGSVVVGQGKSDLDRLGEKISGHLESRMVGWRGKRVQPFFPGSNILVQSWSSNNRIVGVTVAVRESEEDARKEIKSFLQFRRDPEELIGFGDEAYTVERDGPDIVLRKGRFVVYINSVADIESDVDAKKLSKAEREGRHRAEVRRIGREFAKQLSEIELQ